MSGDELNHKQIKITISEDLQTYKMTRNPNNKEGFYSLQGGYYAEPDTAVPVVDPVKINKND